jgi:hypothetical protein
MFSENVEAIYPIMLSSTTAGEQDMTSERGVKVIHESGCKNPLILAIAKVYL